MYSLVNLFLNSNIYNKSPKFIARKIFNFINFLDLIFVYNKKII